MHTDMHIVYLSTCVLWQITLVAGALGDVFGYLPSRDNYEREGNYPLTANRSEAMARPELVHTHAAHAALAHSGATSAHGLALFVGGASGARGKGGVLRREVMLSAGRTLQRLGIRAPAY